MELFGIKFAPLNVPLRRRLQTLAVAIWFLVLLLGGLTGWLLTIYILLYTESLRYIMLLYLLWIYYDRDTCNRGGRRPYKWLKGSTWLRYFCDYFPIKLVKTCDLEPTRNYLFCSFPHGIFSSGVFGAFATDHLGFHKLFPGFDLHQVILDQHFKVPFFREFVYGLGGCAANARSIEYRLSTKPESPLKGRVTVLEVGGVSEVLLCKPGTYKVLVKKRRGFVRLALKHGVPLVPVFSFGETDLYDQYNPPEGSFLKKLQNFVRKIIGIAPVILLGRGFFQYSFGIIPFRKPVTVVVGKPMELPKISEPMKEQIEEYHEKFVQELVNLFESEKSKYIENAESAFLELM